MSKFKVAIMMGGFSGEGSIHLLDGDQELVMWDVQEWTDEPALVFSMINAIRLGYEGGSDVVKDVLDQ